MGAVGRPRKEVYKDGRDPVTLSMPSQLHTDFAKVCSDNKITMSEVIAARATEIVELYKIGKPVTLKTDIPSILSKRNDLDPWVRKATDRELDEALANSNSLQDLIRKRRDVDALNKRIKHK